MKSAQDLKRQDRHLATLITAQTRLATLDLFQPPSQVSLLNLYENQVDSSVTGAILETQIMALERSSYKERARAVIGHLADQLLSIYDPLQMPLRRAQ